MSPDSFLILIIRESGLETTNERIKPTRYTR